MEERKIRWKKILSIAWPLIIANSFWNLQFTIDRIFLGQFSTEALGAAMTVMGVFWTPMTLLQQTSAYLTTFVAQYTGAGKNDMIGPSVWQSIYVSVVGGILFMVFYPLTPFLFKLIGHPETVALLEMDYFRTMTYSALPTALVATSSSFFTGLGHTKKVIWINAIGLVVNAIFDYFLIFGHGGFPKWGIAGAGIATGMGNWAAAILGLVMMFKHRPLEFRLFNSWHFNAELLGRFLKYGLPAGFQWALEGLAFTVFLIIIGRMPNGEAGLSSSSIVVTIMMLAVLPVFGVAQAVGVLVGNSIGEKNPNEGEAEAWSGVQVAWMYVSLLALTFILMPNFYLSWFKNEENLKLWTDVSHISPKLLYFVAFFIFFDAMNLIFSMALKSAGDTRWVSLVALMLPWPLMVLPCWFMKDWSGAIYWAWGAASVFSMIQGLTFTLRFKHGRWKSMSVINPN